MSQTKLQRSTTNPQQCKVSSSKSLREQTATTGRGIHTSKQHGKGGGSQADGTAREGKEHLPETELLQWEGTHTTETDPHTRQP